MKTRMIVSLLGIVLSSYQQASSQKAVRFDSIGDYIEVPHAASLAPSQLTIELWLKVHGLGGPEMGGEQVILDKRHDNAGYYIGMYNTEFPLTLRAALLSSGEDANAFGAIDTETWNHIAVTYDNTDSLKIYLNGRIRRKDRRIIVGPYEPDTTMIVRIGGYAWYPDHGPHVLKGEIDDLRIWDYARSQEEIASMMHEKLTGNESGLAAYWNFDNQTNSTILDLTPNGNDGIVHGNALLVDSDAPIGFVPPQAPVGLRAYGGDGIIDLAWKPDDGGMAAYALYRGDSSAFAMDSSTLIATVQAPAFTYSDANVTAGQNYYYRLRAIDREGRHSTTESRAMGRVHAVQNDYLTGVYYYPWYWSFFWEPEGDWPGYHRYYLQPKQPPMIGLYTSRDQHVIRQHLEWMQSYGIDFIVINWSNWSEPRMTLRDYILPVLAGSNIRFAVFTAAEGFLDSATNLIPFDNVLEEQFSAEFAYFADTYFNHPNYLTIDGRTVIFFYLSGLWSGNYVQAFDRIRSEMQARGYNLYLVGDEGNFDEIDSEHMQFLDAVSPYIILEDDGYPIDVDFFGDLSVKGGRVDRITTSAGIPLIPNVNPGSAGRHLDSTFDNFPRQSTAGAASTSTLEEYIKVMRPFVDPKLNMMMITSWNEWWEDTQIEPTIVSPPTTRDISDSETFYSAGYSYEGYGLKALEVVQELLASGLVLQTIDHFTYTAHTDSTYSISVSDALLGGVSVETGDEIGVFDGDLCVGAVAVTGDWPLGFWAWVNSSVTVAIDGFTPGNVMNFRIWDASSKQTYTTVTTFASGDSTFGSGAYAQVSLQSKDLITDIQATGSLERLPDRFVLAQNYPNPFNSETTIKYQLPEGTYVAIKIYNTLGQEIRTLVKTKVDAGYHQVRWDGKNNYGKPVASGIYFYQISTSEYRKMTKLLLLR